MSALRDLEPASSVLAFFGAELRRLRSAAELSQEDLGQRVSYSGSLVGMVETARRAPTLLQTEDYARALITAWQPGDGRGVVEQQVTARIERQQLLDRDPPPLMWMIIGESALRSPVGGPKVLSDQLHRLVDIEAEHPKVIIQVVPLTAEAHPGSAGSMLLLTRPGEPDMAYLEVHDRGQMLERPGDVARYGLLYDVLRAVALPPDASRQMIADLAKGIRP
jgi:transcriptional regulator with XRE-family HTH domain